VVVEAGVVEVVVVTVAVVGQVVGAGVVEVAVATVVVVGQVVGAGVEVVAGAVEVVVAGDVEVVDRVCGGAAAIMARAICALSAFCRSFGSQPTTVPLNPLFELCPTKLDGWHGMSMSRRGAVTSLTTRHGLPRNAVLPSTCPQHCSSGSM